MLFHETKKLCTSSVIQDFSGGGGGGGGDCIGGARGEINQVDIPGSPLL